MVRTPHFPCWGAGVESLVRELRSHKLSYANKRIGGHKVTEMPNFCFFVFLCLGCNGPLGFAVVFRAGSSFLNTVKL